MTKCVQHVQRAKNSRDCASYAAEQIVQQRSACSANGEGTVSRVFQSKWLRNPSPASDEGWLLAFMNVRSIIDNAILSARESFGDRNLLSKVDYEAWKRMRPNLDAIEGSLISLSMHEDLSKNHTTTQINNYLDQFVLFVGFACKTAILTSWEGWDDREMARNMEAVESLQRYVATRANNRARRVSGPNDETPTRAIVQRGSITPDLRADVWDKSHGRCWHCGVAMHPFRNFHVDHYVPVIDGGATDIANLVPACQPCNGRKGSRPATYLRRFFASGRFWFEDQGRNAP